MASCYTPRIPDYVAKAHGGRRNFKRDKRADLRILKRVLDRLCMGSAYFPDGSTRVDVMREQVKALEWDLGVKAWGR